MELLDNNYIKNKIRENTKLLSHTIYSCNYIVFIFLLQIYVIISG